MTAFYNEHDPFAAAWLRELIKAGHIAPGDVDERDMWDVVPGDIMGYDQWHFCAGIGTWSYALRCAGWPDNRPVLTISLPCQSFSAAGKGGGLADERGQLAEAFFWIAGVLRPDCILGEQVEAAIKHDWLDVVATHLEREKYAVGAVGFPAAGVGAPHIRQRLYWVAQSREQRRRWWGNGNTGWMRGTLQVEGRSPTIRVADAERNGGRTNEQEREAEGRAVDGRGCTTGIVAEIRVGDWTGYDHPTQAGWDEPTSYIKPIPLAYAEDTYGGTGELGTETGVGKNGERRRGSSSGGNAGVLGDSGGEGLQEQRSLRGTPRGQAGAVQGQAIERTDPSVSGMVYPMQPGSEDRQQPAQSVPVERGPTNGFWADAEWLPCRDNKARPTGRGIRPLVVAHPAKRFVGGISAQHSVNGLFADDRDLHGIESIEQREEDRNGIAQSSIIAMADGAPAGMVHCGDQSPPADEIDPQNTAEARVGRLRGYGNSLCAPAAIEFIKAYMEV